MLAHVFQKLRRILLFIRLRSKYLLSHLRIIEIVRSYAIFRLAWPTGFRILNQETPTSPGGSALSEGHRPLKPEGSPSFNHMVST